MTTRAKLVADAATRSVRPAAGGYTAVLASIKDAVPEFGLLDKNSISIDEAYQRGMSKNRVTQIARNWSWSACGALKVALRPNGDWFAFDGQHRLLAAKLREDISTLPCLIYEMDDRAKEADGYLSQTVSKSMTIVDRFKAMVVRRDPIALVLHDLALRDGLQVRSGVKPSDKAIGCVGVLLDELRSDEETVRRIWPLLVGVIENGGMMTGELVKGAAFLERAMQPYASLRDPRWAKRLTKEVPWVDLKESMDMARKFRRNASPMTCGVGLLNAINRNLRTRLVVPGIAEG